MRVCCQTTMRRETDFVLEQAAWPAMLLEENGRICRVNQAARRVFDLPDSLGAASLASLWDDESHSRPEQFLPVLIKAGTAPLKLRVAGGAKAPFVAHGTKVARDGQSYLVLQLFKDSSAAFPELSYVAPVNGTPPPPVDATEENSIPAGLANAAWPVLMVRKNGKVLRANAAAIRAFGSGIEKEDGTLDSIWPSQNQVSALQFLSLPPTEVSVHLTCKLKSGLPCVFLAQWCLTASDDIGLLQLFKEVPVQDSPTAATPKVAVSAASATMPAASPAAVEASQAHKQKLDCALQLARTVALDFNNALTSILGHASLLLSKAEASHPWRSSLNEIEKSAAKAAEVANDLAAFSRQDKDVRVPLAGNVNTVLERTVLVVQSSLQKPIKITCQFERRLFTANFDEAKMQQALIKILENAIEAIEREGSIKVLTRNLELSEPLQDHTAKLTPGNYVCVEVSDTGGGIAPDVLPRIFEPFFTTKGAPHRGLGLAWVYGIITNHGGAVSVSSQPGQGAAVRMYLPATRKIVRAAPVAPTDLKGTQTILFVDDEDILLTMGQMILSSYGYTVLTASSGQKALEIFTQSKKKIDLVITDLVMPNMSGRELSEQILRVAPNTRILWSSGYARSTHAEEQERYLQKPFTSQDLLRKVKQVLTD